LCKRLRFKTDIYETLEEESDSEIIRKISKDSTYMDTPLP